MGWHTSVQNGRGGHVAQEVFVGVWVPPASYLFREPFYPARWMLVLIPKPQAHWLLLVQWGLEADLGRSLWIIPYVFLLAFMLVRGVGEVLFCC